MTRVLAAILLILTSAASDLPVVAVPVEQHVPASSSSETVRAAVVLEQVDVAPTYVPPLRASRSAVRHALAKKKPAKQKPKVIKKRTVRRPAAKPTPKPTHTFVDNAVGTVGNESVYTFVDSLPQPWPRIVRCESLRDNSWHTYSNSMARGLFQFLRSTWRRMGGTGDPAAAPWVVQYVMALKLERTEGLRSWDCARMLGLA